MINFDPRSVGFGSKSDFARPQASKISGSLDLQSSLPPTKSDGFPNKSDWRLNLKTFVNLPLKTHKGCIMLHLISLTSLGPRCPVRNCSENCEVPAAVRSNSGDNMGIATETPASSNLVLFNTCQSCWCCWSCWSWGPCWSTSKTFDGVMTV